jgi:hypothetical protein
MNSCVPKLPNDDSLLLLQSTINSTQSQQENIQSKDTVAEKLHQSKITKRLRFTKSQTSLLESTFLLSDHPNVETINDLVNILDVTFTRLNVWFQNRRAKKRRILAQNYEREYVQLSKQYAKLPIKIEESELTKPLFIQIEGDNFGQNSYNPNGLLSIVPSSSSMYGYQHGYYSLVDQDSAKLMYSENGNSENFGYGNSNAYYYASSNSAAYMSTYCCYNSQLPYFQN